MYRSYDRDVRIWNSATGQVAANDEFRFSHATPVLHIPKSPAPVRVRLDSQGKATVRLPGVFGMAGTSRYNALIHARFVRDGGTVELVEVRNGSTKESAWRMTLSKAAPESGKHQEEQAGRVDGNKPSD
jgi:hypothetical protein